MARSKGRPDGLTHEDGTRAVELARDSVRAFVENGRREEPGSMRDAFYDRSGAFVRLETATGRGQLRGCAGAYDSPRAIEEGNRRLGMAIVDAAIEAASEDSRSVVTPPELDSIAVTVFVAETVTETSTPADDVEVGHHGVAMEGRGNAGWMFPTVPVDNGWGVYEYLDRTARKAGLSNDAWMDDDVRVVTLDGPVFAENDPGGSVQRRFG
ncbi:TIGR00296 family protein [Halanaeroarchaeum sulfurireducens]|uniref:AMMECR1 domain protein n=1 Tax=Halanaeroarchaeum sulfurireducens TaxID=1604004 RepID=A0A0F7P9A0_9EURY|nr:TIGR00296 family protein [Halanaeroarchaeum sulfurireducens]AKH96775.1 AMMECR1 domain protein [Halanaeroarchaeum sulfurireducens]ALG81177.1 AMMECR1 domain protein [Halanaeroarchaeum sulfurireducens]